MRAILILCSLLIAPLGWTAATCHAARGLDPTSLGEPLVVLGGIAVYAPWKWVFWHAAFGAHPPAVLKTAQVVAYGSLALSFAGVLAVRLVHRTTKPESTTYGSARWSTIEELRRKRLLEPEGVVLAQTHVAEYVERDDGKLVLAREGELICHNGPEHCLFFAPTGAGKSIGTSKPTLWTWRHSALVLDIKKELWTATAGWRSQFSHVLRVEPTSPTSVRFNPLEEVRRGELEVRDAQVLGEMLVDPGGDSRPPDPHWDEVGKSLQTAVVLHVLYAEADKTLSGCAMFVSHPERTAKETLERMRTTKHLPSGPHPVVASTAREMLNKSEKELSGVFSTAARCFALYRDPTIARATSRSDFRIADLRGRQHPMSLYLVLPPSDIKRLRPFINLLLNQIGQRLMEDHEATAGQHRLLMLLDEMTSLGRLAFLETQAAYMRSYGIKLLMIVQSLNQLEKEYGSNSSLLDNAHVRVTMGANNDLTAKRISNLLGQATLTRKHTSFSKKRGALLFDQVTVSDQEYARPLRTAGEVMQLPEHEALVMIGGLHPYLGKKVRDYLDPGFRDRAAFAAPSTPEAQAAELPPAPPQSDWWSLPPCAVAAPGESQRGADQALDGDFEIGVEDCLYGTEEVLSGESDAGAEVQS